MISLVGTCGLFVRLLLYGIIGIHMLHETFGDGILPVAVPTINDIIRQGPRNIHMSARATLGAFARKGWFRVLHT